MSQFIISIAAQSGCTNPPMMAQVTSWAPYASINVNINPNNFSAAQPQAIATAFTNWQNSTVGSYSGVAFNTRIRIYCLKTKPSANAKFSGQLHPGQKGCLSKLIHTSTDLLYFSALLRVEPFTDTQARKCFMLCSSIFLPS
jgi:hypothetical protein